MERAERNRGAAGGPTGWTFEQLRAAVSASAEARAGAHAVVNLMLSGKLPRCGVLLDSNLVGLAKPGGGVRPIAIGEVWYRLAGLCAITALEGIGRTLAPLQLCVGVPGGAEAAGLAVTAALAADPAAMVLSVDVENCFNSLCRGRLFAAVKRRAPGLLPFVQWAYGAETALHVVGAPAGAAPVPSVTGVKQGDPLGTLLAALVLHEVQEHVARAAPGLAQVAFADDINLVGGEGQLRSAWQCLGGANGLPAAGLRLQARKSALSGGDVAVAAALAADLGVTHAPEGIVVAGTPVGCPAFVARAVLERAEGVVAEVDEAMRLPLRAQSRWLLVRMSLSQRMAHLMRVVPWAQLGPGTRRAEQAVLAAVATLFRLPGGHGPGAAVAQTGLLAQLCLPERVGGFGLRSASATGSGAAMVACAARAQAVLEAAPLALQPLRGAARARVLATWHDVFDDVGAACEWGAAARELPPEFERDRAPLVQRAVARVVADRDAAALLHLSADGASPPAQQRAAARLRSAAGGPASAMWTAVPTAPDARLSDDDLVMAGRHRLGLGPGLGVGPAPCTCGAGDASAPDHAQVCTLCDSIFRHDIMVNAWRCVFRDAGCATSREPPYSGVAGAAAGMRRGDIVAVLGPSRVVVADVVVTHAAAASYLPGAARETGVAAARAERRKRNDVGSFVANAGFDFVPLATESYGHMGTAAMRLLSDLGDIAASSGRVQKHVFLRVALRRLSCTLARGNGRMYTTSVFAVTRALGRNFVPGRAVPVAEVAPE